MTNFGAFGALGNRKSGLVHISEIANALDNDVHDFMQGGQNVTVLVLSTANEKLKLSIKKALPQQERPAPRGPRPMTQRPAARPAGGPPRHARSPQQTLPPSADQSFEDKLKQFLSSSEGKMADLNRSIDGKRGGRRRR
ncbi:MAG: S1 RNA-binding domain-containing protein [Dysosmobacter sp.]|uniref:S1 RNA-binding domain-containing protein n=1 Tax=Dysosmobacter sp. TaxID=2591382 RepID=UPI00284D5991|nr:S1 RNA-binding domain-containing protein [Dysosmobacter sp.]MDR3981847.1 S1 RNA-binding domain-containing protein [Dysosmobacter sp.]